MTELPSLSRLREFGLNIKTVDFQVRYLKARQIDWDVYLPSKNMNLQRGFCWTARQQQELIWSILFNRNIPRIALVGIDNGKNDDSYQVIDGKQRLNAIFEFIDDVFPIYYKSEGYRYSDLPSEYQAAILRFYLGTLIAYDDRQKPITDEEKIGWFTRINFAGTPQDEDHRCLLNQDEK